MLRAIAATLAATTAALAGASASAAAPNATHVLAERYAPVLQLEESHACGGGRPIEPIDVNLILANPEVALRGPWDRTNIVRIAPTAHALANAPEGYHLDFPGSALRPGCTYDNWARRVQGKKPPVTYARVATDPAYPGHIALQYWFFYVFNNFNDKHEGDWETIQLDFDAGTAAAALRTQPTAVGYSQHSGAESAAWTGSKLERVGGTHAVVYPALGSHANYFRPGLYLGKSAAQGIGCDDSSGSTVELNPRVEVIPNAETDAVRAYPWLTFRGHWGEQHPLFYDGPTGPNTKSQWRAPLTWAATTWRTKSFSIPTGFVLGRATTHFFCGSVALGSSALTALVYNPSPLLVAVAALLAFLTWLGSRTSWGPAPPLPLRRRRSWGTIVSSSGRMYLEHPRTFLTIGLLFIPFGLVISVVQFLLFKASGVDALVNIAGRTNAFVDSLAIAFGLLLTLIGLALAQSATALVMADLDSGRRASAVAAYRRTFSHLPTLLWIVFVPAVIATVADLTIVGAIVAVFLIVRWSLAAQATVLEERRAVDAVRTSARLVAGNWWRTASLMLFVTAVALLLGPLLGTIILFASDVSVDLLNVFSGIVYVVVLPFVAIATTYLYEDLRIRRTDRE